MSDHCKGLVIAAPKSGSGKTTISLGLARALRKKLGQAIPTVKSGPDYIDPQFLTLAGGGETINLDAWAMDISALRHRLNAHLAESQSDLFLVEGAMGLFDGAANGKGSTAELAKALGLPVILVIDVSGMSQSIAALVHGFMNFDPALKSAGIVLNNVGSARHEAMLKSALVPLHINIVGACPRRAEIQLPSRHLGLVEPQALERSEQQIEEIGEFIAKHVDLDLLQDLMAPPIRSQGNSFVSLPPLGQRIAIAKDAAFSFIYTHILRDWQAAGAELSFFSPLKDEMPAANADAIFLPGGYPENFAQEISNAARFKAGLVAAKERGALIYGECGGYMVLGETVTDKGGSTHQMTGLLPVHTRIDRPTRKLGYRILKHQSPLPIPKHLRAHEFHYSSAIQGNGKPLFQANDALGESLDQAGLQVGRVMGSYMHIIDQAGG